MDVCCLSHVFRSGKWEEMANVYMYRAIFDVQEQAELVNQLLTKYGMTVRLRASLLSPPGRGNLEIAQKLWHWSTLEYGEKCMFLPILLYISEIMC